MNLTDIPNQNPHYLQDVTDLGEDVNIIASDDIYAANGMKLLAKGARINRSQRECLQAHKLRLSLDQVLSADVTVTPAQLSLDANKMLAEDAIMRQLAERSGDPRGFKHVLGTLILPPPLLFRLTVMREQRQPLYQHSLRAALITHAMAARLGLSEQNQREVVLAALCHDMGEMHTDPLLLTPGNQITSQDRRFIHVHPVTSYCIMQDMQTLPAASLQAVLQHHERLDGSGYPHGLKEEKIHPLAKLLCVTEVMEGVLRRGDKQQIDILLRLNQQRFDPAVTQALRDLLGFDSNETPLNPSIDKVMAQLNHVAQVLAAWPALNRELTALAAAEPAYLFMVDQMSTLHSLVLQAGIDPSNLDILFQLFQEDTRILTEMQLTLNELAWRMADMANEIERRTTTLEAAFQAKASELVGLLKAG
ncbi:MAG: HD domain-containing phosphohydrolase [Rugosibacter sp.]|jgi:HD-GYP domain-containing protein (c-di-GMP phosphodiesterase class II)|nr:hypothetical protein [Rugosibacter sp.]